MKNYISKTPVFACSLLGILLFMGLLPSVTVFDVPLKKVELLSDVLVQPLSPEETELSAELPLPPPPPQKEKVDSCKEGMSCIVDYADSTQRGMQPFYRAVDAAKKRKQPIRIAVIGDSFIEGDIFTGDLRNLLQDKYGGCGVGFVGITSPTYGFRKTVRHFFKGWESHFSTDTASFYSKYSTLSGSYFIPKEAAVVQLKGQTSYGTRLDSCAQSSLFYLAEEPLVISSRLNGGKRKEHTLRATQKMEQVTVWGKMGKVRWQLPASPTLKCYGVSMEGNDGIVLDNFAIRGSAGFTVSHFPLTMLQQLNALRPYDLIILEYGLNVVTKSRTNYDYYQKRMVNAIAHLKKGFPQAGFLLLSVGDRDVKNEQGTFVTMKGVKSMVRYQQQIAYESRIAFWNMFEGMGGEGSMATFVHAKPSLANYDYTHINFRGGARLATLLFETMLYDKEKYDRQKK